MGAIMIRHNWASQPRMAVELDRGHPLAHRLRAYCIPVGDTFVDLVSGLTFARQSGAASWSVRGQRFLGANSVGAGYVLSGLRLTDSVADSVCFFASVFSTVESTTRKRVLRFAGSNSSVFNLDYSPGSGWDMQAGVQTAGAKYPAAVVLNGHPVGVRRLAVTRQTAAASETWRASFNGITAPILSNPTSDNGQLAYVIDSIYVAGNAVDTFPLFGGLSVFGFYNEYSPQSKLNALTANPYQLLRPMQRRLWVVPASGTENKAGVLAITNDSSLGLGGIKGALGSASFTAASAFSPAGIKGANGSASFTAAATFSPAGIKSATGYVSFSSASEFGVSGILEQSDDKIGAVVFVNESTVGASGLKNALGGFGISHTAEFGASGVKGVLMPELSQASGVAVSSSEISGSVYTNKNTGTLYAVATLSSTKPSVAQIQAGQNHLGASAPYATSQAVSTYGLQSVAADGLTFNTPYYWHFQHKDGEDLDSTVITSAAVRTADLSLTLDFPDTAPCSLLGYQVWSKLTVTDGEIAAMWEV